jgi:hypothetical protein
MSRSLLYDIETTYLITREKRWGLWDDNPIQREIVHDWQILCFAYKWLDEKKVHFVGMNESKGYKPGIENLDDTEVVKKLSDLFNEADVVIAHNGNSFDQKKVQARMMIRGLEPPLPYAQIDTMRAMKQVASHTSNKLSELAKRLEITNKEDAGGIATWDNCIDGDPKAWRKMKKYNIYDVKVLEELYLIERPWIKSHPKLNVLDEKPDSCPKGCGGKIIAGAKYTATATNKYQFGRCNTCGSPVKFRIPEKIEKPLYT